ncbi:MAG: calcium/sodium antiporter [Phycisphaeraceae bacterium]|nr:calcium/sodium antiporter [Phycisphaeraceae bacterium]
MVSAVLLVVGLVVLVVGAEFFVRGASTLAGRLGISPLVVGLTVVAFGTSAPELAVSLSAVANETPDLAVGNVVGSNIFNVLFILGLTALIQPLVVDQKLIRIDVPLMILASGVVWWMAMDGRLIRWEGAILFAGVIAYTTTAVVSARRESAAVRAEYDKADRSTRKQSMWVTIAMLVGGIGGIVLGAHWLVEGAKGIAVAIGISDLIIGLTIVAAGTSLPEVATSVVAAVRGHRDIAVGNAIGSNLFNIMCILGLTGVLAPGGLPVPASVLSFDFPVMFAVAVACLPVFIAGRGITRYQAAMLFLGYLAYTGYLVLDSAGHDRLADISAIAIWFVLPLAGVGVFSALLGMRRKAGSEGSAGMSGE